MCFLKDVFNFSRIIFTLMRYLNLLFLNIIIISVGCNSNNTRPKEILKDSLTFYRYGLSDSFERNRAEYVVAKRWQIHYKQIANCVISKGLADSAANHNREVSLRLNKKYGINWKAKIDKAIDNEVVLQQRIIDTLRFYKDYKQLINRYSKKGKTVTIWFEASSDRLYLALVETQDWVDNRSISTLQAKYAVDLQTWKIKPVAINNESLYD